MAINDIVMAEEVRTNLISAFNEERECPPSGNASGSKMQPCDHLPSSLTHGLINSTKIITSLTASSDESLGDDESDLSISNPDSSPVANSIVTPDEVLCEQYFEVDLQKLFVEDNGNEK